jgi:hypothetical protein
MQEGQHPARRNNPSDPAADRAASSLNSDGRNAGARLFFFGAGWAREGDNPMFRHTTIAILILIMAGVAGCTTSNGMQQSPSDTTSGVGSGGAGTGGMGGGGGGGGY